MLKPVLGLAATGIAAVLLWKLFVVFILPLFAVAVGVAFLVMKIGFILLAVWFAFWLFKRLSRSESAA
jgi:hypothetical protein